MKGKRGIAGILLVGILAVTLTGCKTQTAVKETEKAGYHARGRQLSTIQLSE